MADEVIPAHSVDIEGTLVADPELRTTPKGLPVCRIRVAVNKRTQDPETKEWVEEGATYYNCSVWRGEGSNVAASLKKGMHVRVSGWLKVSMYTGKEDGYAHLTHDIDSAHVSLTFHFQQASVTKVERQGSATVSAPPPPAPAAAPATAPPPGAAASAPGAPPMAAAPMQAAPVDDWG